MKSKKKLAVMGVLVAALAMNASLVACGDDDKKDPGTAKEYTVTFDANGGTLTGASTLKVKSGGKITSTPTATKAEHVFEAWYDSATDGVRFDLTKYTVTKDVTLYAHYTPGTNPPPAESVTITFNANGGTFTDGTDTASFQTDENGLVFDAENPTRADHRFTGWFTAAEGGEMVAPMFDPQTEARTLYAQWVRQYTITFDANGGTLKGSETVKVDENTIFPAVSIPTASKAGNDFYGWFAADATEATDLTKYTVVKDETFTARYGEYTMPLKRLKDTSGTTAVGYRIEAETSKVFGETNSENQQGTGFIENNQATASGNSSIGYFGKTGNTMTYTFKSENTGTANLALMASSAKIFMDFTSGFVMYPVDQTVTTTMLSVKFNNTAISFDSTMLRGSYENMAFNKYWAPISLGDVNVVAGTNTLEVEVLQDEAPNFDYLDIVTEMTLTSVNGDAASGEANQPAPPAPEVSYEKDVSAKLIVVDHADGPAVKKSVLTFADDISATSIAKNPFSVGGMGVAATDKVYLSDADGNKVETATSKYVTIEYAYTYSGWGPAGNVKPFNYDMTTNKNSWKPISSYAFALNGLELGDTTYTKFGGTFTAEYVIPELEKWDTTGTYTDGESESAITLKYASFTPAAVDGKDGKKPLVIWLHGAGEGGTDPSIALLGNQVVNLGKDSVQKYFQTETIAGAYVLAPQSPTMWMDKDGTGTQGDSDVGESYYTEALFNLIQNFVTEHSDIDANRVYIGGCSNGGWMTVEMLSKHGEFFAAAYPVAVPFVKDAGMTADEFAKLVNVPMWITHAKVDQTVQIGTFEEGQWGMPGPFKAYAETNANQLYIELLKAGATNVHYSLFDTVTIAAGEDAATYNGHYSWIYVLRDECVNVQAKTGTGADNAFTLADIDEKAENKVTLGDSSDPVTLWGWLAAQAKTDAGA